MRSRLALVVFLCALPLSAGTASQLGDELRRVSLDPANCYRIRDVTFQKGDASYYLTDGFLIFGRPVGGRIIHAAFQAVEPTDDAEILLRPPDRGERASMLAATGSPLLSEHFRDAVFIFTDGTGEELLSSVRESPLSKRSEDMGLLMESRLGMTGRNLASSFQVRILLDILTGNTQEGIFYSGIGGLKLGNFDLLYDPASFEPITIGQVTTGPSGPRFKTWASFQTRARLQSGEEVPVEGRLDDYRIDVTVHPDLLVSAVTRVAWIPERENRGALGFEITGGMKIGKVTLDGAEVEIYREESMRAGLIGGRENDPFLLVLPEPLKPGRRYELEFHHEGRVIADAGNGVYFVGARTNWYPARGLLHAGFDLTLRVPKHLNVVATGEPVSETEEGEWRIVRRRTSAPVRLAGFNLGSYDRVSVERGGLQVEVVANRSTETALQPKQQALVVAPPAWSVRGGRPRPAEVINLPTPPPPDPKARMRALAEEVSSAMEWMSQNFGPPPLKTLTVSPIPGFFGQGFPGLVYLSTLAFLSENERPGVARTESMRLFYNEILHAHEAAHQWWGNLVMAGTYRDDWVQEALANYSALMVVERKKGAGALDNILIEYRDNLLNEVEGKTIESAGPITWGQRMRASRFPDPWRVITYDKGSWIIHMLRRRMGDKAFLAMLGELRRRFEYKTITTDKFRQLAAEFTPKGVPDVELINFFDNWVYGTGIPTLEISHTMKGKAPKRTLAVTVRQSGVSSEFGIDLPVEIRIPGRKDPVVKWIRTADDPVSFTIPVTAAPQKVELAPQFGVLAVRK